MKRRRRDPNDPEVQEAVLRRLERMTREEWLQTLEELSHAPEGVEDPWPPYDVPGANGSAPAPRPEKSVTPRRKA